MIVNINPDPLTSGAETVTVYSNAPDNLSAVRELDEWARQNGFFRSREYTLNVKQSPLGERVYYGACYRLTEDTLRAANTDLAGIRQRRIEMPVTQPIDDVSASS